MLDPDLPVEELIRATVQSEIATAPIGTARERAELEAFRNALVAPFKTTVNFSGGFQQICWTVTRTDGTYRVIYMPVAGYFSLCRESDFGPLDMGVHGSAMGCFGSV